MQTDFPASDDVIDSGALDAEGILDALNADGDDAPEEETEETNEVEESEVEETDEDPGEADSEDDEEEEEPELADEEDEVPDEEELELATPASRKAILAKYPKIFKDFPHLERAYYREQQFTDMFPTVEDATLAQEKARTLDSFEEDVKEGNIGNILRAVKTNNEGSFKKMVDNYLGVLAEVDPQANTHLVGNILKRAITAMNQEGDRASNNQLKAAAQLVNQFIFGTSEYQTPTNLYDEQRDGSPKVDKAEELRVQLLQDRFNEVSSDLVSRTDNQLRATVDEHIDPRGKMSAFVKKHAVAEAVSATKAAMENDTRFRGMIDGLWKKAAEQRFSPASVKKIRSTYLAKAKTILGGEIKKARLEALKGTGNSTKSSPSKTSKRRTTRPSSSGNEGKSKPMSTYDFLNQD